MSFYQLAPIGINEQFIEAAKSMGWDETNYRELLNEIGPEDGYVVNSDVIKDEMEDGAVELDEVDLMFTFGDPDGGNRWYATTVYNVHRDANGVVWASVREVEEACG